MIAPPLVRPVNEGWQANESRLTILRGVKMRLPLARVERVEVPGAGDRRCVFVKLSKRLYLVSRKALPRQSSFYLLCVVLANGKSNREPRLNERQ